MPSFPCGIFSSYILHRFLPKNRILREVLLFRCELLFRMLEKDIKTEYNEEKLTQGRKTQ